MYEHKSEPLLPLKRFYQRVFNNLVIAMLILLLCTAIGMAGFHYTCGVAWIDALHNACMLLSGMGPVITINSTRGKLFSSAYALFSGIVFISTIGFMLAPSIHRFFHKLHLGSDEV